MAVGGMWHYACGGRRHPRATFGTRKARAKHAQKYAQSEARQTQARQRTGYVDDRAVDALQARECEADRVRPVGRARREHADLRTVEPRRLHLRPLRAGCSPHACMRAMPRGPGNRARSG